MHERQYRDYKSGVAKASFSRMTSKNSKPKKQNVRRAIPQRMCCSNGHGTSLLLRLSQGKYFGILTLPRALLSL